MAEEGFEGCDDRGRETGAIEGLHMMDEWLLINKNDIWMNKIRHQQTRLRLDFQQSFQRC